MKIKFVKDKGCAYTGYVSDYPEEQALSLIENGFAVEYIDEESEPAKEVKIKSKLTAKESTNG